MEEMCGWREEDTKKAPMGGGARRRRRSYKALGSSPSPRSPLEAGRWFSEPDEWEAEGEVVGGSHFLDACFLCRRPLGGKRDIFMYMGDKPFCTEECREEQMERDEEEERSRRKVAMKASSSSSSSSSMGKERIHARAAGTVVAG